MLTDVGTTTQAASEDPNNPEAVEPDAEVSFVTKDLATVLPKAKLAAVVALDEVLMRVRDAAIQIVAVEPAGMWLLPANQDLTSVEVRLLTMITGRELKLRQALRDSEVPNVIFSGEAISQMRQDGLEKLRDFLNRKFDEVTVIGYMRSPKAQIQSRFQQRIRSQLVSLELDRL